MQRNSLLFHGRIRGVRCVSGVRGRTKGGLKQDERKGEVVKNRWIKNMILILMAASMAGCGRGNQEMQTAYGKGGETSGTQAINVQAESVQAADIQATNAQALSTQTENAPKDKEAQALNTELFDTSGMHIQNGKGNTLLALKGDTLYLYDVTTAQIRAETKTEKWDMVNFYPYRGGYCAIGYVRKEKPMAAGTQAAFVVEEVSDEDMECFGIFYDDSLKEKSRIRLDGIVQNAAADVWGVSPDGTVLGYYDHWEGLNLYDLEDGKKQRLLDVWTKESGSEFLSVNAIFFDEDGGVVFSGQSDQNGSTVPAWGRIGRDGTGLEKHILKQDLGSAAGYGGGKLLLGEDSIFFTGGVALADTETGEAVYKNDWDSTLPVSGPFFSADGTVFASAAMDTDKIELAVYRTADFSLLYRETIRDEREELFYRRPQICLFPELQVGIVCMGGHNDIPQKSVLVRYGR